MKLRSFKDGFKRARKSKKSKNGKTYTQETFADEFNETQATIKNWEQGKTYPRVQTLLGLCDFFDCDMDYLFNTIDCKTHDTQFIQDKTGLTESSIDVLIAAKKNSCGSVPSSFRDGDIIQAIDFLLKYNHTILIDIAEYLNATVNDTNILVNYERQEPNSRRIQGIEKRVSPDDLENVALLKIQNKLIELKKTIRSGKPIPETVLEDKTKRISDVW